MSNYLDNTYAAIDGVLLSYTGHNPSLCLPGRLANMPIRRIGNGAFMDSQELQHITVPAGVTAIGDQAFYRCFNLRDVSLPGTLESVEQSAFSLCGHIARISFSDLELSRSQFEALRAGASAFGNGCYLVHSFPEIPCVTEAVKACSAAPANTIPHGIGKLFTVDNLEGGTGPQTLARKLDCCDFRGQASSAVEEEAFIELLASDREPAVDCAAEQENDRLVRIEHTMPILEKAVFTFDSTKTVQKNGKNYITANILIGYHFWQAKIPIVFQDKLYYLYSRHYLTSGSNLNYIREDVAVFLGNQLVTNREEAKQVYAKYRLLTLL